MSRPLLPHGALLAMSLAVGGAPALTGTAAATAGAALFSFHGAAGGEHVGAAVAAAGDMNGDGYADVIVGAPLDHAGGTDTGRAYVLFGGAAPDSIPDLVLSGEAGGDFFGESVSGAGDVNGDGFADVMVGARALDASGTDPGRVYVYFGGTVPDALPDLILVGESPSDRFGFSVGRAGDFDGDGFADLIVGAPHNDAGGGEAGRAYVFRGGATPDSIPDFALTGPVVNGRFGFSVAAAADFLGDGFADVVVGAPLTTANGPTSGRAYLFRGGPAADAQLDLVFTGAAAGDLFGFSLAAGADLNGDGRFDLVIGSLLADAHGADAGSAAIFFGGTGADSIADLTLPGEAAGDQFGVSAAIVGDVSGDGIADLLVGATGNDAGGSNAGAALFYFGGPGLDAVPDLPLRGAASGDGFGTAVAGAGDVDHDGYADAVVGAPTDGADDAGRAVVIAGCDRTTATLLARFEAEIVADAIELRWQFGAPDRVRDVVVERGPGPHGPWRALVLEARASSDLTRSVDRTADPLRVHYYRLVVTLTDGARAMFGPVRAEAVVREGWGGPTAIVPNPSPGSVRIDYTVARDANVRISVVDVAGREVGVLVDAPRPVGRHSVFWDGRRGRERLPAGVYLVRWTSGGVTLQRRLVLSQ